MNDFKKKTLFIVFLLLSGSLSFDVFAGFYFDAEVRTSINSINPHESKPHTIMINEGVLWIMDGGFTFLIFRKTDSTITLVDQEQRNYKIFSIQEIDDIVRQARMLKILAIGMNQNKAKDQETMAKLTAKMSSLENMSNEEIAATLEAIDIHTDAQATGESRQLGDLQCEVYNVALESKAIEQMCIANRSQFDISDEDWSTIQAFLQISWKFLSASAELASVMGDHLPNLGKEQIEGVPVQLTEIANPDTPRLRITFGEPATFEKSVLIPDNYVERK